MSNKPKENTNSMIARVICALFIPACLSSPKHQPEIVVFKLV